MILFVTLDSSYLKTCRNYAVFRHTALGVDVDLVNCRFHLLLAGIIDDSLEQAGAARLFDESYYERSVELDFLRLGWRQHR